MHRSLRPSLHLTSLFLCALVPAFALSAFAMGRVQHRDGGSVVARPWDVVDIVFTADQIPRQPVDVEF